MAFWLTFNLLKFVRDVVLVNFVGLIYLFIVKGCFFLKKLLGILLTEKSSPVPSQWKGVGNKIEADWKED